MSMALKIQRWGNSAAIRLSGPLLSQIGAQVGDSLEAEVAEGKVTLKPAKQKFVLSELLAQCNLRAPVPKDAIEWESAPAVGNEKL